MASLLSNNLSTAAIFSDVNSTFSNIGFWVLRVRYLLGIGLGPPVCAIFVCTGSSCAWHALVASYTTVV